MTRPATDRDALEGDAVDKLLLKFRLRDKLSEHEAEVLRGAVDHVATHPTGTQLVAAGETLDNAILLLDGYVARYKMLAEGQRQITEIHVPGDFVDLHGYALKRLEHDVGTLTPARIALVPHSAVTAITETEPHLGRMLWLSTLIDGSIQRERLLTIGRRSALARVAHLICELFYRLDAVGLTDGTGFHFPVPQIDLADANGLTSVHVNRMLRQLRDKGLMVFRGGRVEIQDLPGLEALAEFDPSYLYLGAAAR